MLALLCALSMDATFTNPVWDKNFPDPFIVQEGNTFYAFATQTGGVTGFQIMSSRNLVSWQHLGGVNVPDWSDGQLWAPEVYKFRGKWYMLYSARDKTSQKRDLAVSVADKITGPYTFVSKLVLGTSENQGTDDNGAIDANLYVEKGTPYLLYIREAPPRAVKIVQLSKDLTETVGEAKPLLVVDREVEQGILDAPTLIKREDTYWLFYSSGWFQSSKRDARYQVWAAGSKSLMGPYVKPQNSLLKSREGETYSPGHQCVFKLRSGEWWMAYHAWDPQGEPRYGKNPNGRTLRLDRLDWSLQGPICHGPTLREQPVPRLR